MTEIPLTVSLGRRRSFSVVLTIHDQGNGGNHLIGVLENYIVQLIHGDDSHEIVGTYFVIIETQISRLPLTISSLIGIWIKSRSNELAGSATEVRHLSRNKERAIENNSYIWHRSLSK